MSKHVLGAFVLSVTAILGGMTAGQAAPESSKGPYGVVVQEMMVPMPDGIRLYAKVFRPAHDGVPVTEKLPVLVNQEPYAADPSEAGTLFASRGFIFAKVWSRGSNKSEGTLVLYLNEAKDGPHVVEWFAQQPWSNGWVGTWGVSYSGMTQYSTALGHPPHLKAQFIDTAAGDYHEGASWSGGALMVDHNLSHMIGQTLDLKRIYESPELRKVFEDAQKPDAYSKWLQVPASRQFELFSAVPETVQWAREWLVHAENDAYWKQVGFNLSDHVSAYPDVPVYFVTGWMDHLQKATLRSYANLKLPARGAKSPIQLMVGPWIHQGTATSWNGQTEYGPEAASPDFHDLAARFFERAQSGSAQASTAPVRLFVMGTGDGHRTPEGRLFHGGVWRDEQEWPLRRAQVTRYYLRAGGLLGTTPPAAADPSAPSAYAFDPANPVPTIFRRTGGGWDQRCLKDSPGCHDTLPLAARPDVLVFRSAALEKNTEVTGPLTVTLAAASSAVDTDFTVKLIDEYPSSKDYPEGFALMLSDMILRGRYRNSFEKAELLVPNAISKFVIEMPATSNVFKAGHHIRLDVSSSNFPKWDVNPNTGEPIGFHTHTVVAYNRVYHDNQHLSYIELPIVASPVTQTVSKDARRQ